MSHCVYVSPHMHPYTPTHMCRRTAGVELPRREGGHDLPDRRGQQEKDTSSTL